jgi:uncharacterized repeat protein (TIGR01451 family)
MIPVSFFRKFLTASRMLLGASLAAVALLVSAATAQLGTAFPLDMCPADRFGNNLGCTANDVQITNIRVSPGSNPPSTCEGGSSITLDLDVTVNFGSNTRYDIGIFLAQDGASPQRLSTRTTAAGTGSASCKVATLPTNIFPSLDPGPYTINGQSVSDTCGDGSTATVGGGTGSATFTIPGVIVRCQAIDSSGALNIPFVVSWDQNSSPTGNVCTGPAYPLPGTTSKCNAPLSTEGNVTVVTVPKIFKTNNVSSISPGDTTTYTITIANTTGVPLTNMVFKDPAVANLNVSSVSCAVQNGTCPAASSVTVAAMQGSSGITLPSLAVGGTMTFTVNAALTGNPTGNLTNVATVTVNGVTVSAYDIDTIVYPNLVNTKTVAVLNDPVNGATNPKNIPGAEELYTIKVENKGQGRVDSNTLSIVDALPANTSLYVGNLGGSPAGPITYSSTGSNLTFTYTSLASATDDLEFSKDNGANWNYVPAADASGYDPLVTNLRFKPKGRMAGWSGTGAYPSFAFSFKVKVR